MWYKKVGYSLPNKVQTFYHKFKESGRKPMKVVNRFMIWAEKQLLQITETEWRWQEKYTLQPIVDKGMQ